MPPQPHSPGLQECGVRVTQVRIAHFRSLENVEVDLDGLTVLVGANNAGKTSFLDALYAAIGSGRRTLGKEDIHLKTGETDVPLGRKVTIDLLVKPCGHDGSILDSFPSGSFWTGLWGDALAQDDEGNDFIGIRTELSWNATHNEYRVDRKFLKTWQAPSGDWLANTVKGGASSRDLEPLVLHYMDAQRDIENDLHSAGSFWRRLVNDLGLSEEDVKEFESTLTGLNDQVVARSPVLKHLHGHLQTMDNVVTAERSGIDITPVARHLRDLAKGIDINFATTGAQSFPLARHGMGTRSLASILVFRAYASWRSTQAGNNNAQVHTLLALEEPEAHLHPQAQRSLFRQIKEIPGQRILSTHSPYFAGQARLEELRLFQKSGSRSTVTRLDTTLLGADDRRKLEQQIIQTRGDILFCRALILFEGPTEELALPIYAQAYWGMTTHELGFNFVPVGGTDYFPLIWLAQGLGIKWYVFSDGETIPVNKLNAGLTKSGLGVASTCSNVVVIPNGLNMERYLIDEGYLAEIETALKNTTWKYIDLDDYINKKSHMKDANGVPRNYNNHADGRERAAMDALSGNKTGFAIPVASAIVASVDPARRFPPVIADLFAKISADFGLNKAGGGG